ncbi:hypothetical protein NDU88_005341 [Pleurodeles waltl]|uniref:Uncharacterized protein n=1 Tax=Pleurodeles waltl TaxID=8319 RepID=A0AAV7VMH8_PLEWA|nr:hypothetical protein NDU88_005341 [Pleurodeles waltl]
MAGAATLHVQIEQDGSRADLGHEELLPTDGAKRELRSTLYVLRQGERVLELLALITLHGWSQEKCPTQSEESSPKQEAMPTQRQGKEDSTLRDLFAKTLVKKQEPARDVGTELGGGNSGEAGEEDATPVTKAFMKQLFEVLREDLAALRQELTTTVKELKGEVAEWANKWTQWNTHVICRRRN